MAGPIELVESATVGIAVGTAAADAFEPTVESAKQTAWTKHAVKVLDPATAAQLVAQGLTDSATAYEQAARSGYGSDKVDALVQIALRTPGISEGLTLWRRGFIDKTGFEHICAKAMLEPGWAAALEGLKDNVLSPQDIALGMVRNNIANADAEGNPIFPGGLSSAGSQVPQHGYASVNAETEAAASGYDLDRFTVIANNVGLPPGVIEGLQMLNRGIISEADFALLIEQSDTRIAWGPFILQLRRMLLTAHEYAELYLRGWIKEDQMHAGTALHGLTQDDADLLVKNIGRPLAVHQITTGLARGGTFGGFYENVPPPYLEAIRESNIRPEYGNLAYANRYTYPSYFVIKPLVASGAITVDEATQIFENEGWPPDLAAKAAQSFASTSSTATATPHLKSAVTSAVTAIKNAYVGGQLTEAEATGYIQQAEAATTVTGAWDVLKTVSTLPPATPIVAPPTGG